MSQARHPTDAALMALAAGREASAPTRAHVDGCERCSSRASHLASALAALGEVSGDERVDPARVERAARAASRRVTVAPALQRLSARAAEPATLRDASGAPARWCFDAGEVDVTVQALDEDGGGRRLVGQVTREGRAASAWLVHLRDGRRARLEYTDRWGEFDFGVLDSAAVEILLESDDAVWLLPIPPAEPEPDQE